MADSRNAAIPLRVRSARADDVLAVERLAGCAFIPGGLAPREVAGLLKAGATTCSLVLEGDQVVGYALTSAVREEGVLALRDLQLVARRGTHADFIDVLVALVGCPSSGSPRSVTTAPGCPSAVRRAVWALLAAAPRLRPRAATQ